MAASPKTAKNTAAAQLAAQVDELGSIEQQLSPYRLLIAREEQIRKAIRAFYDSAPAGEPFECTGTNFTALIGCRAMVKTVNLAKLIKAIGLKKFAAFATCTLAALNTNAPGVDCIEEARTGTRSLKLFERARVFPAE